MEEVHILGNPNTALSEKFSMPKWNSAGNSPMFLSIFVPGNAYQRLLVTPRHARQYTERILQCYGFICKSKPLKTRRVSQVINRRNVSSTYSLRRLYAFVKFKLKVCQLAVDAAQQFLDKLMASFMRYNSFLFFIHSLQPIVRAPYHTLATSMPWLCEHV